MVLPQKSFLLEASPCAYLPARYSRMEYAPFRHGDEELWEQLLEQGWRRFGSWMFRPRCGSCHECRSIRIPIATFKPSKSQRRTLSRNEDVTFEVTEASISDAHIQLYNRYHNFMAEQRGWPERGIDYEGYHESFLSGNSSTLFEFRYKRKDRLIGIGLVDIFPNCLSSGYFYHDPDWREDGPGTFSLLQELRFARERGMQYLYLGYWIRDCQSMQYKSNFGPAELLEDLIDPRSHREWKPFES